MFGNPYQFLSFFEQESLFYYDINENLTKIEVYFYHDNNFTYFNGIETVRLSENVDIPNIWVKDVYINFAYDAESVKNESVKI
jgi:hypothetical protein